MRTSPTFRRSTERTDMHKTETVTVLPGVRFAYVGTEDYKNASFAVGFKYKTKRSFIIISIHQCLHQLK